MRTRTNGTVTGPIETAHAFGIRRPVSTSLNRAPNRRIAAVWRKSETPSPLMITPMLRALRSGRYAKRSIPYPSPPQTIIASPSAATTMTSPGSRSVGSARSQLMTSQPAKPPAMKTSPWLKLIIRRIP